MKINLELPIDDLLEKFSFLKKYENHDWFQQLALKNPKALDTAYYELSVVLIMDLKEFTTATRFNSGWERNFSLLHRYDQILSVLNHFKNLRKTLVPSSKIAD